MIEVWAWSIVDHGDTLINGKRRVRGVTAERTFNRVRSPGKPLRVSDPQQQPPPAQQPAKEKSGIAVKQVIGAILLLVAIVFILENTRKVKMRLIIPEVTVSLAVALVIAVLLGGLGVLLLQRRHRHKR